MPTYNHFFQQAMGMGQAPYLYQQSLAGSDVGRECTSQLIDIPTGLGKTAAVVLAWLWNRVALQSADWPRRLVYCLPMRTLVEQTEGEVKQWVENLLKDTNGLSEQAIADLTWLRDHSPIILMGGEELDAARKDWDLYPEKPAILIGTQDMLLSRALNRGYGMSRYRWPMHFGLLNNDCLWVMDETQLMGVGVETSAQLDGFRHQDAMHTHGACPTWWMSATLHPGRLATVDHPLPTGGWPKLTLRDSERANGRPAQLIRAPKPLTAAPFLLNSDSKKGYAKAVAELVVKEHVQGTLTLVIVDRVVRAQEIYEALTGGKKPLYVLDRVGLVHSRFRPIDRKRHADLLTAEGDRIVIATQAVEAGVDVSARVLITELAPWSSLVQRFGRCNRRAEYDDAKVIWIDIEVKDDKDALARPYTKAELDSAREVLHTLSHVGPLQLAEITVAERTVVRPVIRRRDLVDLFDTTPDICGMDLDISRYIRDGDDNDVQLFWRTMEHSEPAVNEAEPSRDELCRVSIGDAKKFFEAKSTSVWKWDPLDKTWKKARKPLPGAAYLVASQCGGYNDALGWTIDPKHTPTPLAQQTHLEEGIDDEPLSVARSWMTIGEHTDDVLKQLDTVLATLGLPEAYREALRNAALWHDVGKAHWAFQVMMRENGAEHPGGPWAKSAFVGGRTGRPGFRHELASALAWLLAAPVEAVERDLSAYLIAAHHGKVRLSIRSLPNEQMPEGEAPLFARGVWHGDMLDAVQLSSTTTPPVTFDLSFMRMGDGPHGPSWLARTTALRDALGPFLLAYLETLLRAADGRASQLTADHHA